MVLFVVICPLHHLDPEEENAGTLAHSTSVPSTADEDEEDSFVEDTTPHCLCQKQWSRKR